MRIIAGSLDGSGGPFSDGLKVVEGAYISCPPAISIRRPSGLQATKDRSLSKRVNLYRRNGVRAVCASAFSINVFVTGR